MSSACRGSNGAIPPAGDGVVAMGDAYLAGSAGDRASSVPRAMVWGRGCPGPPTQAPVARVPRCFPWYFKHSPEIAFDPYILGRLVANGH